VRNGLRLPCVSECLQPTKKELDPIEDALVTFNRVYIKSVRFANCLGEGGVRPSLPRSCDRGRNPHLATGESISGKERRVGRNGSQNTRAIAGPFDPARAGRVSQKNTLLSSGQEGFCFYDDVESGLSLIGDPGFRSRRNLGKTGYC